ncbi:LytTR family DNA-binding domain-containing protein [Fulvimonas sp. R45]|uniref:LytR/AlgR family response regulator transcription factor n=1 Tax=Fulvimonas sp. R45 TaxID=3045937 RepID=UPI00265F570B|nr:LytTR family DNA-binding domain-containing protein [Fulvimonas sp. R45]MDO1529659.1 LytTR family DNA-binding domain-containing protein [Fulvimonas sp. R45]
MTTTHPTALVADDEPLLREALVRQLAQAWPALRVVAQARNGREAVQQFEEHRPDVCFLDVHMPGLSGIEAARHIGGHAQLVFVTAYDHYAVQAFEQGALDYLVKPVEPERLAATVARLQTRWQAAAPVPGIEQLLQRLAAQLQGEAGRAPLRWLRAQVGQAVRLIAVEEIDYLRSDAKYTRIAWRGDDGRPGEAVVGTPLKALAAQLDATRFAQVHRSVVVNLGAVSHVVRNAQDTASIHLRGRDETLPVSRRYLHLFRTM